jgi:hypothetical protein
MALDAEYSWGGLALKGEFARAKIGIPSSLVGLYAENQWGGYGQMVYTLLHGVLPMFPNSTLAIGARYDYVDLDSDVLGDDTRRVTILVNVRLVPETVVKLDYQHDWIFDRINNETRAAVIQFDWLPTSNHNS